MAMELEDLKFPEVAEQALVHSVKEVIGLMEMVVVVVVVTTVVVLRIKTWEEEEVHLLLVVFQGAQ
jgi:hypothetical protein